LHALASAANRSPDLLDARRSDFARPIAARQPGRVPEDVMPGLAEFAETARTNPQRLTPSRWQQFLEAVGEPTTDRIVFSKPGCNDEEQVPTPEGNAATIKSRFWTDASVGQMAGLVDPKNWVASGAPFWQEMTPVPNSETRTTNPPGYTATFKERVLLPFIDEVTVYLDIEFEKTDAYVHTTYQLAANPPSPPAPPDPNKRVVFDSGWICATGRTIGPQGEPTLVEGLKSIRFANPLLNEFPDLACDGGWVYLMIEMARRGAELGLLPESMEAPEGVGAPAGPESPVMATITRVVDTWVDEASGSLRDHGDAVKTAVGRALAPGYDLEWVNDLLGTGKGAVATTKHTIQAWREILDALATLEKDR
jgi:hypothetical protein